MSWRDSFSSLSLSRPIRILLGCLVLLVVFWAGMMFGVWRASFSYEWSERYTQNFGAFNRPPPFRRMMMGRDLVYTHGAVGSVVSVQGNELMLKTNQGVEEDVVVTDNTSIRRQRDAVSLGDIHPGDTLVVVGMPDASGKIQARFIRVMVSP